MALPQPQLEIVFFSFAVYCHIGYMPTAGKEHQHKSPHLLSKNLSGQRQDTKQCRREKAAKSQRRVFISGFVNMEAQSFSLAP